MNARNRPAPRKPQTFALPDHLPGETEYRVFITHLTTCADCGYGRARCEKATGLWRAYRRTLRTPLASNRPADLQVADQPLPESEHEPDAPESAITPDGDRDLSVERWLLSAAENSDRARVDWRESGLALMRCGTIIAAIRMSHDLIHAAAGTHDAYKIDAFLREVLPGGGVFVDTARNLYFVLVQHSVGRRNEWVDNPYEQAKFLGDGSFLGVPSVRLKTRGAGRAYWCAPVEKAGEFVSQEAMSQLLAISRWRLASGSCGSAALSLVSLPQRRRAGASQVEP
ncbi:hypothetical protein [Streptomyces capitiformicae]|uniref:Uncharacterized protein n=1 Tax=Streptomyces capitiformicae TaxID=2014920 RepID=A0A918Z637_9ACTN|nr:hypothetical protein [Streptomyces capitiformicae]GHE39057.1 hypothetical protein GCM10017771_57690 [Streptomyces capitiformicae]